MAAWTEVFVRAQHALLDPDHERWSVPELLLYAGDSLRALVKTRPDLFGASEVWTLQAGARQVLPAEAEYLLGLVAEVRQDGGVNALTLVDEAVLDLFTPGWRGEESGARLEHYLYDPREPRTFWVVPAPDTARDVRARFVRRPQAPADATDEVDAPEEFAPALLDYVLYRCFMKDADDTRNEQRALSHLELFNTAVGAHGQTRALVQPAAGESPKNRAG